MNGDRDAVKTLLKQAADVNGAQGDGMTALHWAAMKNDAELAQTLLYAGANVRAKTRIGDYTPLVLAAKNGNAGVLEPLIAAGADVNGKTSNGSTALMLAAASGSVETVKALVDRRRRRERRRTGARLQRGDVRRGLQPRRRDRIPREARRRPQGDDEDRRPEQHRPQLVRRHPVRQPRASSGARPDAAPQADRQAAGCSRAAMFPAAAGRGRPASIVSIS